MTSSNIYNFDSMYNYDFMEYIDINSESTKVLHFDGPLRYNKCRRSTTKFYNVDDRLYNFDISVLCGINIINPSVDFKMNEVKFEIGGSIANKINFEVFPMRFNETRDNDYIKTYNRNNSVSYELKSSHNMFTFFTSSLRYHELCCILDFDGTFEKCDLVFNVYNVGNNFSMKSKEMMMLRENNDKINFTKENQRRVFLEFDFKRDVPEDILYFKDLKNEDIEYIRYCDKSYNVISEVNLDRLVEFNKTIIIRKYPNSVYIDIKLNCDKDVTLVSYRSNYQRYMSGMSGIAYVDGFYYQTMTSIIENIASTLMFYDNCLTEELNESDNLNIHKILLKLEELRFDIDINLIYYVTNKYLGAKSRMIKQRRRN